MEYVPHNYLCHTLFLDKLSRSLIHRTVNRLLGVENDLHEHLDGLQILACSEPFIWSPWIEEFGRNIAHSPHFLQRLKKEISYKDEIVACKAICTLNELVHHPELAVEAIRIRLIPRFVKPLKSDNIIILQRSLLCLKHLCMQPMGVASIIENKYIIENIRNCIRHPTSALIRCQASRTVNALVHSYFAVHTLVEAGYVKVIMKCIFETKDFNMHFPVTFQSIIEMKDLMVYHLDSLLRLMDDGDEAKVAVMSEGVFDLSSFLTSQCIRLKIAILNLFVELAKHPIGKNGIVAHDLIPILCEGVALCNDTETKIKMAAVLLFATIHKEGRKQAFKCNLIGILGKFLPLANVPLNLKRHAINILTNLAELPEGREVMIKFLKNIKLTILVHFRGEQSIQESIDRFYKVIKWKP